MKSRGILSVLLILVTVTSHFVSFAHADEAIMLSKGQMLYVPAYSHIYAGNRELQLLLTVTLSIRNVDIKQSITITAVDYYGTKGEILKNYLDKNVVLGPLESTRYIIPYKDKAGGSGANFVVVWKSEKSVNLPIVECVMIGAEGQQGISFVSRGQAITNSN
ncbi:MAG: DUF3124 domain-containing protein [Desulfocapsaceae bacterium]|jgi:hypothetical protein|nr:DUF3124 domain-containing protein [Desulfocapsaceae bacterium]